MKKTAMFIGMLSMIAIVSCKQKEETPVVHESTTIEVQAPAVEEKNDGTSISLDSDGLDINTKSGSNQTKVEIKK